MLQIMLAATLLVPFAVWAGAVLFGYRADFDAVRDRIDFHQPGEVQ